MSTELSSLQTVINDIQHLPYCTGTVPLDETTSTLFYQTIDQSRTERLDFTKVTDQQLDNLARACDSALDDSYHKAGKMDTSRFAIHFSPTDSGILEIVGDLLLRGRIPEKYIRLELSELNVYGPGGFSKAPIDTPSSDTMFGSLVVVLPTVHEGGSLVIRRNGKEWTFDPSKAVKSESEPTRQAAFVALVNDAEHEVMPVSSGYRVSLTYSLHIKEKTKTNVAAVAQFGQTDKEIKNALEALVKDTTFLPEGGLLGFGFAHKYPFSQATTNLSDLGGCLKGTDAAIQRACDSLSLITEVHAVYRCNDGVVLLDHFAELGDEEIDSDMADYLTENEGGVVVCDPESPQKRSTYSDESDSDSETEATPIVWVKPLAKTNTFSTSYVHYGNEASLSCVYGELCLVATVLPGEKRGM